LPRQVIGRITRDFRYKFFANFNCNAMYEPYQIFNKAVKYIKLWSFLDADLLLSRGGVYRVIRPLDSRMSRGLSCFLDIKAVVRKFYNKQYLARQHRKQRAFL